MNARIALRYVRHVWTTTPWLHWAAVYAIPMLFFLVDKLVALSAILDMYASKKERTFGNKLDGVVLGMVQDFIVTSLLVGALVLLELVTKLCMRVTSGMSQRKTRILTTVGLVVNFFVVLGLVILTLAFFVADLLLVRSREMRFTTEFIFTYLREKAQASGVKVDRREIRLINAAVIGLAAVSLMYAFIFVRWVDLLGIHAVAPRKTYTTAPMTTSKAQLTVEEDGFPQRLVNGTHTLQPPTASVISTDIEKGSVSVSLAVTPSLTSSQKAWFKNRKLRLALAGLVGFVVLTIVTQSISVAVSPVVAAIALNKSLNELFRNFFHIEFQDTIGSGSIASADYYLHSETESYELFQSDVLYRRTTGFKGPLAFNVSVEQANPPNVLIIGVESFRYLLNTLADITGVPEGGFLQTGVGRSLKRQVEFGSRPVWSNNPMRKMSVVRGHERFVYDRSANPMGLFDTVKDPLERNDLLPSASEGKVDQVRQDRRAGRELNAYFKRRWDKKCLTSVT